MKPLCPSGREYVGQESTVLQQLMLEGVGFLPVSVSAGSSREVKLTTMKRCRLYLDDHWKNHRAAFDLLVHEFAQRVANLVLDEVPIGVSALLRVP
jgi:hypothetical protein